MLHEGDMAPAETLKGAFLNQMGAVAMFDLQGRYVYVNERWEEHLGLSAQEVLGRDVQEVVSNTTVYDVLQTGRGVSGMPIWPRSKEEIFRAVNYVPLYRDGALAGCAMYTIFNDADQAEAFYESIQRTRGELKYYKGELQKLQGAKYSIDHIVGRSKGIDELKRQILYAARTSSSVLIEGETGCGKELVAHAIHTLSARSPEPFVKINCAAIPQELAESELFGYEEGAFTGAKRGGKLGKFELANRGSLFLDEINQLPLTIQPKLLRVLQEHEIERVGGKGSLPVNVRILAASNQPLERLVAEEAFRSDLFYRLNVIQIRIPPLRERKEDIPLLAEDIVARLNQDLGTRIQGLSEAACALLAEYDWPGNVRELQNSIERAMNRKGTGLLRPEDFQAPSWGGGKAVRARQGFPEGGFHAARAEFERQYLLDALRRCHGNKKQAAEQVGLSRAMFYRKLQAYHLE